jgi:membrane fusion protein (multidrug efflux system)
MAETASSPEKKKKIVRIAIIAGSALVLIGLVLFFLSSGRESTDDAFIEAHIIPISPKVAGSVQHVYVKDNQKVKAGELLVDIDDRDYVAALAEARAKVAQAEAEAARASTDAARYAAIYKKDGISKQVLDQAHAAARTTQAKLESERAAAQKAELDLSYTKLVAPQDGQVTRKAIEPGAYVQVGQIVLAIVGADVWVTANFKETQITHIRPGQPVRIKVDTYPGKAFEGHVDSIQAGTGERFSLMPPENATGNYVKVVQRVPVKIVFDRPNDQNVLLAPGMSVVPSVQIR